MVSGKQLLTGLLLLIALLAATQTVRSQQYATTTLTTLVTSNQVSTVSVGTQLVTSTATITTPVYAGNVSILGTHGVCGEYFFHTFNGTAGEVLTGTVSAATNNTINVYVMTPTGFDAWQHQVVAGGTCTPTGPVSSQAGSTGYTLSTTLPSTGTYELVVHNLSKAGITAEINTSLITTGQSVATVALNSTTTQPLIQTVMQTSVQTLQTSSTGIDPTTLAAIIFAIIVIAAAAYVAKTRRSKTTTK